MGLIAQQTFPLFLDFTSLKTWSIHRISLWALCAVLWLLAVVSDMRPPPTDGQPGQPGGRLKQLAWAGLGGTGVGASVLVWGSPPSC